MRRYVLTGPPGSGKTAILSALADSGLAVVPEAATDVIAGRLAQGVDQPWNAPGYLDAIVALQISRQRLPVPAGVQVQFFDRSPVCTLALARYLGRPVPRVLAVEIERLSSSSFYQHAVFMVRPLGSMAATASRTVSSDDSLELAALHEAAYLECGYELIDVPVAPVEDRAALIQAYIAG